MSEVRSSLKRGLLSPLPCDKGMRKREVIEKDGARIDIKTLEVLIDIRDLLNKTGRPRGRPKKIKGV